MKKTKAIIILFLCAIIYSCSPLLYVPTSSDATQQQQLITGRKIYVDHCGSCHNLHLPKEYNTDGWKKQLNEMQVKAKITDEEKQLVLKYLTSQP
jgi:mono/diheme cytochrome c family protein